MDNHSVARLSLRAETAHNTGCHEYGQRRAPQNEGPCHGSGESRATGESTMSDEEATQIADQIFALADRYPSHP